MSALDALQHLTRDARALAQGEVVPTTPALSTAEAEVARQMAICNACRYCEGFCAVFPAMTRRLDFGQADIHFLANLCHNCGACLHACQYAPPHEFAVNVPQAMATVRGQTYTDYAWPRALGKLYQRNGLTLSLALAAGLALFLLLALALNGTLWGTDTTANFYSVFPHNLLVGLFAPVFLWAVLALGLGVRRFWQDISHATSAHPSATAGQSANTVRPNAPLTVAAAQEATVNVATLTYLDGGHGEGCHNADEGYTLSRRRAHHLVFYGFMLCFAATSVATLYHYVLNQPAPYALPSLPKLLGVVGGVLLLLGCVGLFKLNLQRHPLHGDAAQKPMDLGFIALLSLTSASGLALWLAGSTPAMPAVLAVHLGAVMALFATTPYGKLAHGVFRTAALLRHNVEKRLPNPLALGDD